MVYLFMYRIIINQKTAGDQAVTNMYLNIIRSAITKNFYECERPCIWSIDVQN